MVAGSQGFDLGNAHGKIILDASGVQRGIEQAQQSMDNGIRRMGRSISRMGANVSRFGASMTLATAPILAFGISGVRAAARFEDALTDIQVRASLTEAEMERVRTKALEIGRDTEFSALQGADAFLQLLTSGQSVAEAFETVDSVILGAAASGSELGFVSDTITDLLAAFNLEASESRNVMQALSDASGAGSATFEDLAVGFQDVAGKASSFGLSIEETAGILQLFNERGIKGTKAGNTLRSMLTAMTRETSDVTETWTRLGISMFDATGQARPLGDVMGELRVSLEAMTDQERTATLTRLAGSFGELGLTALTTGDTLEDMMALMSRQADIAEIAAAKNDTFSGAIRFLQGSIQTFQIEVLTPFMENTLKPLVLRISDIVNQVTAWAQANPELTNKIVLFGGALVALGPALFIVGKLLAVIGGLITLLASPLGILIATVIALGIAWETNFLGIRDALTPVVEQFQLMVQAILAGVNPITAAGNFIARVFGEEMVLAFVSLVNFVEDGLLPVLEDIVNALISMWLDVEPHLTNLGNWFLTDILPAILAFVTDSVFPIFEQLVRLIGNLWTLVRPELEALWDWFMVSGMPVILAFLEGPVTTKFNNFLAIVTLIANALADGLEKINEFIERGESIGGISSGANPLIAAFRLGKGIVGALGHGAIVTQPTPAIIGDNVPSGSFEAVLQEPQLRALLAEVKGGGGGGDIIINAEPGTLNIAQDPATQGTILAEQLDRKLRELGVR